MSVAIETIVAMVAMVAMVTMVAMVASIAQSWKLEGWRWKIIAGCPPLLRFSG
jgi:uncharacterized membrane protein HdeD (DUF308 family)